MILLLWSCLVCGREGCRGTVLCVFSGVLDSRDNAAGTAVGDSVCTVASKEGFLLSLLLASLAVWVQCTHTVPCAVNLTSRTFQGCCEHRDSAATVALF